MSADRTNRGKGKQPHTRGGGSTRPRSSSRTTGAAAKKAPSAKAAKRAKPTPNASHPKPARKGDATGAKQTRRPASARRSHGTQKNARPSSQGAGNKAAATRSITRTRKPGAAAPVRPRANVGTRNIGGSGASRPSPQRAKARQNDNAARPTRKGGSRKQARQPQGLKGASFKVKAILAVIAVLLLVLAFDSLSTIHRIHRGVSVAGIDVGGLSLANATTKIDTELNARFSATSVTVTPDTDSAIRWLQNTDLSTLNKTGYSSDQLAALTALKERASNGEDISNDISGLQTIYWTINRSTFGASYDAGALASDAYAITRASNVFVALGQRIQSQLVGVKLGASASFDQTSANDILRSINKSLGVTMKNNDISIDSDGKVTTTVGNEGWALDESTFDSQMSDAFINGQTFTCQAPMSNVPVQIDMDQAEGVADYVRGVIASPFTLTYQGQTWTADSGEIGAWIATKVEQNGKTLQLVPYVDTKKAISALQKFMGSVASGTAVNAKFDVSSGTPVIIPSQDGTGPDLTTGCDLIQNILFGSGGDRNVTFQTGNAKPEISTEDAQSMGITELISEYTLTYNSDNANRTYNIERALDLLNGTMTAPGSNWDWNLDVGECDETTGFKEAGVYINGQHADEAGGGICNVATGVFNAAYEGGFPIVERKAHSMYSTRYPMGRDATVSWTDPDFIFTNDTDHWILVTSEYDGVYLTVKIWGTSLHRKVESRNSDLNSSSGSYSIYNYRDVYDATGKFLWEDEFYSYFTQINDP